MRGPAWRRYLRFWGTNVDADVKDELVFHLAMRTQEFEAQGMMPDAAQRAARERFGDLDRIDAALRSHDRERNRGTRRRAAIARVGRDVWYAIRTLRRAPAFAVAAVLCLALGTGATAAVFSIVNAFLFRPLPVAHPGNLVVIGSMYSGDAIIGDDAYPEYLDVQAQHALFSDAVAYTITPVSLRIADRSDRRIMETVSGNCWTALGIQMARGRGFTEAEARAHSPVMVLSYRVWQREFGGADDVIGRSVALNGIPVTIVGVAPRAFVGLTNAVLFDGWIPLTLLHDLDPNGTDPLSRRGDGEFRILARLRDGVTAESAQRALARLATALQRQYPAEDQGLRFFVVPELRSRPDLSVSGYLPRAAFVFSALTVLVLLIACANVALLMLTRVSGRRTEIAVRLALGAGRLQVIRQLLAESAVVAGLGAVGGVGIAVAVVHWVGRIPFTTLVPVGVDLHVDWRALIVAASAATSAALISGMGPALRGSQARVAEALQDGARGAATGIARQRFRTTLVAAQVAVSFLLLVAAGLFLRSVQRAGRADLGFRQDHGLLASVDVSLARYDRTRGKRFLRALVQGAGALPGVRAAGLASEVPLGARHNDRDVYADLPSLAPDKGHTHIEYTTVTPDYFEALGIRVLSGRVFTPRDDSAAPRVMVINQAMASRLWPGQDPVGQHVRLDTAGPPVQVIGVVGTVTTFLVGEHPAPMLYLPFDQDYESDMTLHFSVNGDPNALVQPVRSLVASLDPNIAPYAVTSMATHLRDGIAFIPVRLAATIATGIGLAGLVLAVIGLYGVVAYSVAQRRREIGIRMAVGATSRDILLAVLREGMLVTAAGLAIGSLLALATTRVLSGLLIDVSAQDPLTFVVLAVALTAVTATACWIPAWRAARIAPARVIRSE